MKPPTMTQDIAKNSLAGDRKDNEHQKNNEKREKNNPPTKVVIRRLPPSMNMETFLEQIDPTPKHDYMYFVKGDMSLGQHAFSRAYINFVNQEDIFLFKDKFDGYVFIDQKGNEYSAVVEFAPFQKIPKKKVKKKDTKCGTIEQDPEYIKFLESLKNPEEVSLPSAEFYLEEIENRERELRANNGVLQATTPLIDYLKQKKAEKQRIREEKREERKRKEIEKKRVKEEERRRRKAEKEKERERERLKEKNKDGKEKDKDRLSDDKGQRETFVKLLKNPEREKKESDKESIEKETSRDSHVIVESSETKVKTGERVLRGVAFRDKDWDGAGGSWHRDDEKFKQKDKQRDHRRERDRYKKDGKPTYGSRSALESSSGTADEYQRSTQTSRGTDWHRDRAERNASKLNSSHSSTSGNKSGSDRSMRGGKSYEKSRESIAKARNETKISVAPKSGGSASRHSSGFSTDGQNDAEVASHFENKLQLKSEDDLSGSREWDYVHSKKHQDKKGSLDGDSETKGLDGEHFPEEKPQKEHVSRDPRTERRIRNKDRPSIELYRPGMRRLSLQRNSPQKDSQSSSSSPSPTPQLLGKQLRSDNVGSHQSSSFESPACDQDQKSEMGNSTHPEDCVDITATSYGGDDDNIADE